MPHSRMVTLIRLTVMGFLLLILIVHNTKAGDRCKKGSCIPEKKCKSRFVTASDCDTGMVCCKTENRKSLGKIRKYKNKRKTEKKNNQVFMNIKGCTAPWVSIGGISGCFLFCQDRMNWDNARSYCQRNAGDLAILDTEEKRRDMMNYMESQGLGNENSRHLGASDRSGSWLWINGASVTNGWRQYNTDQPDDDSGDDTCMYLYTKSYPSGRYDLLSDYKCTSTRYFICEKVTIKPTPSECKAKRRCKKAGGVCQVAKECSGKQIKNGCKGKDCVCCINDLGSQSQVWWDLGQNELADALNVRKNENKAKNIILFLGDGMGITASTAGRIYKGQLKGLNGEEGYLAWERFPNMGLLKTYNVDTQVPDSAGTATAYLCGIKANRGTLGVGPEVKPFNCSASLKPEYRASSILRWAQDANKHTGIVTTTRVTHATPAASYAHSAIRLWEADSDLGSSGKGCKDIADQLVNGETGRNIRVILGGGREKLNSDRSDGRDLITEWQKDKEDRGTKAEYVANARDMASVNTRETDFLLGLFSDSHMSYENERRDDEPSLADMTLKAIEMLSKNKKGFFLLVEGGRIDHGLHNNNPQKTLDDIVAFDNAVTAALEELDLNETLVIVTADHSHVMTLNGYPTRGQDILGTAGDDNNGSPYNTLLFTNGPGDDVAVPLDSETHGGEDVAVYAAGPMSHLFHHLHEQNYVAHVMAYAACVGPSPRNKCKTPNRKFDKVDRKITDQKHSSATSNTKQCRLPVLSENLQQQLDHQRNQLISQLGSEVVPRNAPYNDTENHVH